jgi:uncharacterized small protein (DUF1192 family)
MSDDRLPEIRARLDAAENTQRGTGERMVWVADDEYIVEDDRDRASQTFHQHASADIAWLLSTLEAANERIAILRAEIADLEAIR